MKEINYLMKYPMENKEYKIHKVVKSLVTFCISIVALGFSLLVFSSGANATSIQGIPKRPNPPKLVNNLSAYQILSQDQIDALETKLDAFANSTSNQIAIVIIDSLYDQDPSQFATELGEEWQIGQKKFDNGVVILIKPTTPRKVFIAPGYGLEGAIPDATCEDIVQREIIPSFKKGDYNTGLNNAVDVIMGLAKGEYSSGDYAKKGAQGSKATGLIFALIIIVFVFIFSRRGGGKGGMTIGGPGIFFWGGGLGGFGGAGGGGFGGGDSGGFGGFGGGGFGGGGAGGSW